MPLMQLGEYKPDVSDYESQTTKNILNVVPRADGYGPFNSSTAYSSAIGSAVRGGFIAYKTDGSVAIFAGTDTRLYKMNNTDGTWSDVSLGGSAYSSLSSGTLWQFRQFGNYVIAVQANVVPQVFDLTSSSAFAVLGGSPPQASYIEIVGRFVVLSGLIAYPYRIQWSGLNAVATWDGTNLSDYQDLPDGGIVRGVAGGENGVIFQDQAIRRMNYVGSPLTFQIERIAQDKGIFAPYSIIRGGDRTFYHSVQGYYVIEPGAYPKEIGRERVDRTFLSEVDKSNLHLFSGAADPRSSRIFWSYKSTSGVAGQFDRVLCYDYVLDRWSKINISGDHLISTSQPGITLDGLASIYSSIDTMPGSLDDYATNSTPELSLFDVNHKLAYFRGPALEATVETAEMGTDGKRIFVRGYRPITDAETVYGSASYRETQQASPSSTSEGLINASTGRVDLRKSTRYSRIKSRIPAGTRWTFISGIEPDIVQEGLK